MQHLIAVLSGCLLAEYIVCTERLVVRVVDIDQLLGHLRYTVLAHYDLVYWLPGMQGEPVYQIPVLFAVEPHDIPAGDHPVLHLIPLFISVNIYAHSAILMRLIASQSKITPL